MSQINALKVSKNLKSRMVEFALDDNYVRDEKVRAALRHIFNSSPESGGLTTDLWVEGAFPSKSADETLGQLVQEGAFDSTLANTLDATNSFPLDRVPYLHQKQSLKAAQHGYKQSSKPAIVISAGTGAGKTESFLLPMLEDIYNTPVISGEGVSAIILYPMNALVNDQVDRLQEWLHKQDLATFVHFTSETPETVRVASKQGISDPGPFRFRSRQHARGLEDRKGRPLKQRGGLPRILITNYSMLEYMLCRPQDYVFFGKNLRSLILDEAHLYTGNLAAEISLLLKRVYAKCAVSPSDVLQYATSATIGGEDDPKKVLSEFAGQLFSKPSTDVQVVIGERITCPFPTELKKSILSAQDAERIVAPEWPENLQSLSVDNEGKITLSEVDSTTWGQLQKAVATLMQIDPNLWDESKSNRRPAPVLHQALLKCSALAMASNALRSCPRMPLKELALHIFNDNSVTAIEATRRCLSLGAMARPTPGDYPLLPNRIHYLIRSADGIHISFRPRHANAESQVIHGSAYLRSASALPSTYSCDESRPLNLARCKLSGEWFIAAQELGGTLTTVSQPVLLGYEKPKDVNNLRYFTLTPPKEDAEVLGYDPMTGTLGAVKPDTVPLYPVDDCPATGEKINTTVQFFADTSRLQLGLLAEATLMEMPPYPDASKQWKPAEGRRLLLFSDSRTEAARLGPRFTVQHELQLIRAAITEELASNATADPEVIAHYTSEIQRAKEQLRSLPDSSPLRAHLLKAKEQAEAFIEQLNTGQKITDWCQDVKKNPRTAQLLDLRSANSHNVNEPDNKDTYWNQKKWDINRDRAKDKILPLLAGEFAIRFDWPAPTLENAGLAEVVYYGVTDWVCPPKLRSQLPQDVEAKLSNAWPHLLGTLLDEIRNQGAITFGSYKEDSEYEFGRTRMGRYTSLSSRAPTITPLQSKQHSSKIHNFVAEVLWRCGITEVELNTKTDDLLEAAFDQLCEYAAEESVKWLKTESRQIETGASVNCIQIQLKELGLRMPQKLFRCKNTGRITCRSVLGAYLGCKNANLEQVTPEMLDSDPRMGRRRREFRDSQIFKMGLWGEEHSAQLAPQENLRIQNLFKAGVRNILSSTTTLELGIDIGGLNGVLMGNIPPGKANYLQRAGRAGRRADGSSLVLGFARSTPYEREVFLNFGKYLNDPLRKPTIFLNREEIVWRHIRAYLLGHFFGIIQDPDSATGAMNAFGRMGSFCGVSTIPFWKRDTPKPFPEGSSDRIEDDRFQSGEAALADHFLAFLEQVEETPGDLRWSVVELSNANSAVSNKLKKDWEQSISAIRESYIQVFKTWREEYDRLIKSWEGIAPHTPIARAAAAALFHQAKTFFHLTVIESLGDKLVIPRYGFPIGLSQLRVAPNPDENEKETELPIENRFRLQRDAGLALREYVPGSKIIAGGRLITSHGLLKHWTGEDINTPDSTLGLRAFYAKASEAGQFRYSHTGLPEISAEAGTGPRETGELLFTKHGFTTASWDPPTISSAYKTVGRVNAYSCAFPPSQQAPDIDENYDGMAHLEARYQHAGELVLMNSGEFACGFAVCTKCGYAESEHKKDGKGRINLKRSFLWHQPLHSPRKKTFQCWDSDEEAPVLRHQHLAAKQVTHLVLFDLSHWLSIFNTEHRYIANTIAQCLRLYGCQARDLDTREVSVLPPVASPRNKGGCAIVLYDSVSGGSGHVYEMLKTLKKSWWKGAVALLHTEGRSDETRKRAMLRRIVTADSPTDQGVPEYDPLNAEKLFKAILNRTDPELNLQQLQLNQERSSKSETDQAEPIPNLDNLEKLKSLRPPAALMELPELPAEGSILLPKHPRGIKSNMRPTFRRFTSGESISMKSNYLVQLQSGEYAFGRLIQMGRKHRFKPAETKHKVPSEEVGTNQIVAVHTNTPA